MSRDNKNGGFITLDDIPTMKYTAKVHTTTTHLLNQLIGYPSYV